MVSGYVAVILMTLIRQSETYSNLVGCPLPMLLCGHMAVVFPGAGVLELRAENFTLPCGSSVRPNTNFTIGDKNTSGAPSTYLKTSI
jgi:hypothetical protein